MPTDDDDNALFRRMMHGVTPLRKAHPKAVSTLPKKSPPALKKQRCVNPNLSPPLMAALSNPLDLLIHAETVLCFGQGQLPSKRFREFKQGAIVYEARLDLHGQYVDAARDALWAFITQHHHQGTRCVLIIHGKGGHNFEPSALKSHVNHWLKQIPGVVAFHSARNRDGGTGAVYVLLKKERKPS